jgi:casein kinase 1
MSRASHQGKRLSRRDDWESVIYVIIMLVNGHLPWQGINGSDDKETLSLILEKKQELFGYKLC